MKNNKPKIAMIAAMAHHRVIGQDNKLLWDIPEELKWFRQKTSGSVMVMGRKTYESIGRPLPNRTSIVITRQAPDQFVDHTDLHIVNSFDDAIELACKKGIEKELNEVFIIGGQQIYTLGLQISDILYLTQIDHDYGQGDAHFPEFDENSWDIETLNHSPKTEQTPAYDVKKYTRKLFT